MRGLLGGAIVSLLLGSVALAQQATKTDRDDCYNKSGDEAIAACTRVINDKRQSVGSRTAAYNSRGFEWGEKKDHDRAIADYTEALRLDPNYTLAYNGRGISWRAKGDLDRAIADYTEAIRINPLPKSNGHVNVYHNRANAWRAKNDIDRALADYDKAIEIDPEYPSPRNNRGLIFKDRGDYARALADFEVAVRLDPKSWVAARNRANVLLLSGQYDRAIADYDEVNRLDPKAADGLYGRGLAKLRKGDRLGSAADIAASKVLESDIAEQFLRFGIKPDGTATVAAGAPAPQPAASCAGAETHWKSAETINIPAVYEDHLRRFPNCDFAVLARARLDALKK